MEAVENHLGDFSRRLTFYSTCRYKNHLFANALCAISKDKFLKYNIRSKIICEFINTWTTLYDWTLRRLKYTVIHCAEAPKKSEIYHYYMCSVNRIFVGKLTIFRCKRILFALYTQSAARHQFGLKTWHAYHHSSRHPPPPQRNPFDANFRKRHTASRTQAQSTEAAVWDRIARKPRNIPVAPKVHRGLRVSGLSGA